MKPVYGQPETRPDWDENGELRNETDCGWHLSSGCNVSFGHDDDGGLIATVGTFGKDQADGITVRTVTPEQVTAFGLMLIALGGQPGVQWGDASRLIKIAVDGGAVYGALVPAYHYTSDLDGHGLRTTPQVWARIEALLVEVAQLRQRVRTEDALTGKVSSQWGVWYGGDDPNECAGVRVYDDLADAEEQVQWTVGGRLARRAVHTGPWAAVDGDA